MSNKAECNTLINVSLIILFSIMLFGILNRKIYTIGELSSYSLTTVAFENHLSEWITQKDIEDAKKDFPEIVSFISDSNLFNELSDSRGERYRGFYPATYSIFVIPVKKLFSFIGISQTYCFSVTNLILLFSSVLFFSKTVKLKKINRIISFCILFFNPILFYVRWMSAEVFIYSMLLFSITFFLRKKYKLAFIAALLAAFMNLVLILWTCIICLAYFIDKYSQIGNKSILKKVQVLIKENIFPILYFSLGLLWCVFVFSGASGIKFSDENINLKLEDILLRAYMYICDSNIGILPFYGIFFILFIVVIIRAIINRKIDVILLGLTFILVLLGYSLKRHIASGCTLISRYNAWNSVFMISAVIVYINSSFVKIRFHFYSLLSMVFVFVVTFCYGGMFKNYSDHILTKVAKFELDNIPFLYVSHPMVFSAKYLQREDINYINSPTPIIYENNDGYVTKVLLRPEFLENLNEYITIDDKTFSKIKSKYIYTNREYIFLNFLPGEKINKIEVNAGVDI